MKIPAELLVRLVVFLLIVPVVAYLLGLIGELPGSRIEPQDMGQALTQEEKPVQDIVSAPDVPAPATIARLTPSDGGEGTLSALAKSIYDVFEPQTGEHRSSDGLHVYVLLSDDGERSRLFLETLFDSVATLSEIDEARQADARNVFHIPVRTKISDPADPFAGGPPDPGVLLNRYDFVWAHQVLSRVCTKYRTKQLGESSKRCRLQQFEGPYLLTLYKPGPETPLVERPGVLFDLSQFAPETFEPFVIAHKQQAKRKDVSERADLETFRLTLLNLDQSLRIAIKGDSFLPRPLAFANQQILVSVIRSDFAS